jgi:tRNA nucleotidyltransferase (CCA-adding enzyme)
MGVDGGVIDLQGGLEDLRTHVVRCVGSPEERFAEDPARILRAVRFAACLGFAIDAATAAAIVKEAPRLASVAGERIGREFLKIASQPGAALAAAVTLLDRFAVRSPRSGNSACPSDRVAPEGDAWQHAAAAIIDVNDPAVNLVLLHDVGNIPRTGRWRAPPLSRLESAARS